MLNPEGFIWSVDGLSKRRGGVWMLLSGSQQAKFKKCVQMWKRGQRLSPNFRRHMSKCLKKE